MGSFVKNNRKLLVVVVAIVCLVIGVTVSHHIYEQHRDEQAAAEISKACKKTPSMKGLFSKFQIAGVNTHEKTLDLQMNEELSNQLKSNINAYIEDNISVITRMFGDPTRHEDGEGNLIVTGDEVEPVCDTIASDKKFVNDFGDGWKIRIYNAQEKLVYIYSDDKFLDKPEVHLDSVIAKGKQEHDNNAVKLTEAALNAVGNNKE